MTNEPAKAEYSAVHHVCHHDECKTRGLAVALGTHCGVSVVVSQAPQSFGEDLFMHQGLNDISLQILRQEAIDHMLLLPALLS